LKTVSSTIASVAGELLRTALGMAVFVGVLSYVWKARAYRWRVLASSYGAGGVRGPVRAAKHLQAIVAVGGGAAWSYYPAVTVEILADGLCVRSFPPFSIYAPPLFLPFEEMTVRETSWHLNARSYAIVMERGAGVELIVDDRLLGWIRENTDRI
jgi:hypothetical protein